MPAVDSIDDAAPDALVHYCPTCGCSFAARYERCPDDDDKLISIRDRDPMIASRDSLPASSAAEGRCGLIERVLDGRFRVARPLGKGGMGTVYEGVQLSVERPVAIKVIADELGGELETGRRFLREARVLTSLTHPNIVEVFDYGRTEDGTLYLVMELLRGDTLETELARVERLPARRAAEIASQLCDALAAAHAHGTVHRDLKPANVILLDSPSIDGLGERLKVLDFGLAKSFTGGDSASTTSKITQAGMMLGTPLYMAPELVNADVVDARSDLYALGCVLFEMLAGEPPFMASAVNIILARHVHEPAPALPDDVPVPLRALVAELLAKQPDHRPASAAVVRDRLVAFLTGAPEDEDAPTLVHGAQPVRASRQSAPPERPTIRTLPPPPAMPSRSQMMPVARPLSPRLRVSLLLVVIAITVFCAVAFLLP